MTDPTELAALLCSRLCHDLISPVGAVGNGVELLRASPDAPQEEVALIEDSAGMAQAALSYFRVAFGAASAEAELGATELGRIVAAHFRHGRAAIDWRVTEALPRREARPLLLMILAAVAVLPLGGRVGVEAAPGGAQRVVAEGRRIRLAPEAEAVLRDEAAPASPREAHLVLLRALNGASGHALAIEADEARLTLTRRLG